MSEPLNKDILINDILSLLPEEERETLQLSIIESIKKYDVSFSEEVNEDYSQYNLKILNSYLNAKSIEGKSKNTIKLYKNYLLDFLAHENKSIKDIMPFDIREYLVKVQEERHITNRTLDSRRACISSFFAWCTAERLLDSNPVENIKPVKYERIPKEPLSDRELLLIREACVNIREQALVEFLYSTGARVTEVSNIKISDVNLERNEVIVFGKGGKHRKVYLNDTTNYYLTKYLNERTDQDPALFVSLRQPHKKMSKSGIEKCIRILGERAGLSRPLTPHLFRHTCATNLLQRGVDAAEIQKILGHENISTTMIYSKTLDEDIKNHHKKYIV